MTPEVLEHDAVLFVHGQAVREYGGTHGLRDEGLLRAALARPVNRLAYGNPAPDLFDLAAAYAYGLARTHAFHDGNKRTAWACCVLFLALNGIRLHVPAPDVVGQMVALVGGALDEAGFAGWLRGARRLG